MAMVSIRPYWHSNPLNLPLRPYHLRPPRCSVACWPTPNTDPSGNVHKVLLPSCDTGHAHRLFFLCNDVCRDVYLVAGYQGQAQLHRGGPHARAIPTEREAALPALSLLRPGSSTVWNTLVEGL
ncbi:hypothetical protein IG631_19702 [Alternaria alternata]|nr:hypothetical protein IG631_19702 [Alternaria alternata]